MNQNKTHPFQKKYGIGSNPLAICLHAEVDAIKNALKIISLAELSTCDLYVCRMKRSDFGAWVHGIARPCSGYQRAIITFGLQKIYYTLDLVSDIAMMYNADCEEKSNEI
jgi:deoxycytidylate deaminase